MTSRERVLAALEHREPDRVPVDLWLTAEAYRNLRSYLGMPVKETYPPGSTTWSMDCRAELDLVERLGVDIVRIGSRPPGGKGLTWLPDGTCVDEWGVRRRKVEFKTGTYLEIIDPPLKDATIEDLNDYPWPDPHDPAVVEGLREQARFIRENTPYAIHAQFGRGGIYEQAKYLRGEEQLYMDCAMNPEFVLALHEKLCQIEMEFNRVGIEAIGEYVDILRLSPEDLGTQTSTQLSPRMHEEMVRPFFKRSFGEAKRLLQEKNPRGKIQYHSCGAIYPLMRGLIDDGMDIFDPLQLRCKDFEPARLKADFGSDITFLGGIDVQQTLPLGTPAEVREEVRVRIKEMAPGGGYILASSHRLQPDIPPANVLAMYEAAKEYGKYPIKL